MNIFFRIFGWIFGLLCLVSAALQYNDPDPIAWILVYSIVAVVSFAFAMNRIKAVVPLVVGILALLGTWFVFPEKFQGFEIGGGDIKNIEEGREAVGLLIIGLIMFVYATWLHFSKGPSKI